MQNYPIKRKQLRIKKFHFSIRIAVAGCYAFLASIYYWAYKIYFAIIIL